MLAFSIFFVLLSLLCGVGADDTTTFTSCSATTTLGVTAIDIHTFVGIGVAAGFIGKLYLITITQCYLISYS